MYNSSKSIWPALGALAIFALAGYSFFSFTVLQEIDREENHIEANIDGLRNKDTTFEFLLNELTYSHQKLTEEFRRHFSVEKEAMGRMNKQGAQIAELENKVNHLQQLSISLQNGDTVVPAGKPPTLDELAIDYLMEERQNAQTTDDPDRHKLVALSSVETGTVIFGQRLDGGRGTDTINIDSDANIVIDGTNFVSFESYRLENGKPNAISVLAPGLNNLENDKLEILGDPKLDKVTLDGCLAWKKSVDKTQSAWTATDTENQTRQVFVTAKVPVTIGKCDSRYAYQAMHRNFPLLWQQYMKKKKAASVQ